MLRAILVLALSLLASSARGEEVKILLYDPDAAVPNISLLRSAMQDYLGGKRADIRFLPYERIEDFRRAVEQQRPQFALVASWAVRQEGARLGMKPLLVATRDGKPTYLKRLVVTDPTLDAKDLGGKTLATTRMGQDEAILDQVVFKKLALTSSKRPKVIYVSKEIDALLALTFGQVKAALVTEPTITAFSRGDPEGAKQLRELTSSKEILLPMLVYFPASCPDALVKEVEQVFSGMDEDQKGKKLMKLLRFDGWQAASSKTLERGAK